MCNVLQNEESGSQTDQLVAEVFMHKSAEETFQAHLGDGVGTTKTPICRFFSGN